METVTTQTVQAIMTLRRDSLTREKRVSSLEMRGLGQGHVTNQQLQGMIIQLQRRNEINEQMIITLRRQNKDMAAKMQQLQSVVRELRAERKARPPRTPPEGGRGVIPGIDPSSSSSATSTRHPATSLSSQNPFLAASVGAAAPAVHAASPSPSFDAKVGGGGGGERAGMALPVDIFSTGAVQQQQHPLPAVTDSSNIFAQASTGLDRLSLQASAGSGGGGGAAEENIFLTGFPVPSGGGDIATGGGGGGCAAAAAATTAAGAIPDSLVQEGQNMGGTGSSINVQFE